MESNTPIKYGLDKQIAVSEEQLALVKRTIFTDATDDELRLFAYECSRRGVHPLDRLIHPVKRALKDGGGEKKVTFQASIDYMRSLSEDAGDFAGIDEPEYGPDVNGYPEWAKVTVYRWMQTPNGDYEKVAFTHTARWKEFYPGESQGFMWRKMPHNQLAKCAEVGARRKGWPQKLGGLYAEEELQRPDGSQATTSFTETVKKKPAEAPRQAAPKPPKQAPKQAGLGLQKKQEKPEDFRPKGCTMNAKECSFSSYVDAGDGKLQPICSADGQTCGYPGEG